MACWESVEYGAVADVYNFETVLLYSICELVIGGEELHGSKIDASVYIGTHQALVDSVVHSRLSF